MKKYEFSNLKVKDKVIDFINSYYDDIKKQYINNSLDLRYTESLLLSIADGFFFFNDTDKKFFNELGYSLCKHIKYDLEKYGIYQPLSMLSGFGYTCFSVNSYSKATGNLKNFSESLNRVLLDKVYEKTKKIYYQDLCVDNYDLISGISGNLYYLLDCNFVSFDDIEKIEYITSYLIYLSTNSDGFMRYFVTNVDLLTPIEKENPMYINGSLNIGLSHGIIAPLVVLSKAYALGYKVDGIKESITKIYSLYTNRYFNTLENNLKFWPPQISMDEYLQKSKVEKFMINSSWCYGNFSIYRSLYKVTKFSDFLFDNDISDKYLDCLYNISSTELYKHNLSSPALCHGYAGVLTQILQCRYNTNDTKYLKNIENILEEIEILYLHNNIIIEKNKGLSNNLYFIEGYKYNYCLMEGVTGIVLSLLNLFNDNLSFTKLLFID